MNPPLPQQNSDEILKLVEKFGFKFFGYDESNSFLVVAPNGQIVPLAVAYNFVRNQIAKSASGGGPESMPQMPTMPNIPDSGLETNFEKEKGIESEKSQQSQQNQQGSVIQIKPTAPVQQAPVPVAPSPYGDGFKTPFNPREVKKALKFINDNSKKSVTSTSRWLAAQFEKFLAEMQQNGN